MTRRMAPVFGSRSMRASVGIKALGCLLVNVKEACFFFWGEGGGKRGVVVVVDGGVGLNSVPPVWALSLRVRPRRW